MLTIDTPVVNPLTQAANPYFLLAALLSILLHALLLLIVQRTEITNDYKADSKQPIHIYFQTSGPESKNIEAQLPSKISKHEVQEVIDKVPARADPSSNSLSESPSPSLANKDIHISGQSASKNVQPSANKFDISGAKKSLQLLSRKEAFKCNQQEREKLAINCNRDIYKLQNQKRSNYQTAIASTFKRPAISVSEKYKRDMIRVETLLNLQEQLEEQIDTYPENKMFVEQHRSITNEIQMLDKQYKEVNLLKVLDSGIKVIRKAINNEDK